MRRVFLLLISGAVLPACTTIKTPPRAPPASSKAQPSWSPESYARQRSDEAWHLAYATQSWAAEHNGHVILVPAPHNIVVPKSYFADEFSHIPLSALSADGTRSEQIVVLKHGWTTHASSWDFDTDIKFVMFGPGFIKQGVRLERTTLQNIAPTYARLIGTEPPKGSMGRVMTEALVSTDKRPRVIFTVVMDGGGLSLYRRWPDAWPTIAGLAARGAEYAEAKVTQLETATAPSHAAIGTGGYPLTTRIVGNDVYVPSENRVVINAFGDLSARLMSAPTLADEYGVKSGHRAVVIGASFTAMPVLGMVGHGASFDPGNKNHIVVFFGKPTKPGWKEKFPGGENESRLMTNIDLFRFPSYLQGRTPSPYVQELTGGKGFGWATRSMRLWTSRSSLQVSASNATTCC